MTIRSGGDEGKPSALDPSSGAGRIFREIAEKTLGLIEQAKSAKPALQVVN